MKAFSIEQVMVDLKEQDVVLGKRKKNDVAEECRFAYKDIDQVDGTAAGYGYACEEIKDCGRCEGLVCQKGICQQAGG